MRSHRCPVWNDLQNSGRDNVMGLLQEKMRQRLEAGQSAKEEVKLLRAKIRKELQRQKAALSLIKKVLNERDHLRARLLTLAKEVQEDLPSTSLGREKILEEQGENADEAQLFREAVESCAIRLNGVRKVFNASNLLDPLSDSRFLSKTDQKAIKVGPLDELVGFHPFNDDLMLTGAGKGYKVVDLSEGKAVDCKGLERVSVHCLSQYLSTEDDKLGIVRGGVSKTLNGDSVDIQTGAVKRIFAWKGDSGITTVQEHPTHNYVLFLDEVHRLSVFSLPLEQVVHSLDFAQDKFSWFSLHPDGKLLALGNGGKEVSFFDLVLGQVVASLSSERVDFIHSDQYQRCVLCGEWIPLGLL